VTKIQNEHRPGTDGTKMFHFRSGSTSVIKFCPWPVDNDAKGLRVDQPERKSFEAINDFLVFDRSWSQGTQK